MNRDHIKILGMETVLLISSLFLMGCNEKETNDTNGDGTLVVEILDYKVLTEALGNLDWVKFGDGFTPENLPALDGTTEYGAARYRIEGRVRNNGDATLWSILIKAQFNDKDGNYLLSKGDTVYDVSSLSTSDFSIVFTYGLPDIDPYFFDVDGFTFDIDYS
jgi:hypothetical protein